MGYTRDAGTTGASVSGGGRLRSRRAKEADPRTERDGRKGVRRVLFITGADLGSIRKQPRLSQG